MLESTDNILNMRVSAKTIPAKLASAVVRNLQDNGDLIVTVSAIGQVAQNIAAEAMGIAQGWTAAEGSVLCIEDGESQLEVEDRAYGATSGSTKFVAARLFTVTMEPLIEEVEAD